MTGRLHEALLAQAQACEALGSSLTANLLNLLAERLTPNSPLTA
ncbi:MAG: DUF2332 domain-containing protein, partial [Marivivens sp.]|nr:DUF2332 domain-containing protein [Marivivens sp.]